MFEFKEGAENGDFWIAIKGKGDYSKIKEQMAVSDGFEPRLFEVSNSSGYTFMKQVPAFRQEDLLTEDVYILDTYHELFIWVGEKSNKFEKSGALKDANQLLQSLSDGRKKEDVHIVEVAPTREPPIFKVQFPAWDEKYS